jgi:caffeoyl-CoA O-methyltransferase
VSMAINFEQVHKQLHKITPARPAVLQEMEKLAEKEDFPIIGPLVGRFLYQLVKITGAKKVFELGSGYGYSAMWFAMALPKEGKVCCTDGEEENRKLAFTFFKKAGLSSKLNFLVGDGVKLLKEQTGMFDLILNDIDKADYPKALRVAVPKLKLGGVLVSDNMFRYGDVFNHPQEKESQGVITYTRMIYSDRRLFSTIMPVRDGISISIRL